MQGIVSGTMFIACILYVAYHHLSQRHGGLGISSHYEELHYSQLSLSLPLFAFACTILHSWALWSLGWPGQQG